MHQRMATWFVFWKMAELCATTKHAPADLQRTAATGWAGGGLVIEYMTMGFADHTLTFNTTRRQGMETKPNLCAAGHW